MALSLKLLPVALVVIVLFALDLAWTIWVTPMLSGSLFALAINAVLKTGLFGLIGLTVIYRMRVSKPINDLVDKITRRKKD